MNIKISVLALNKAYENVNKQSKIGLISKDRPCMIHINGYPLVFRFHPNRGRRGSWMIDTVLEKVTHPGDSDLGYTNSQTF